MTTCKGPVLRFEQTRENLLGANVNLIPWKSTTEQTLRLVETYGGAGITQAMWLAMKRAPDAEDSPLRRHAADALRRARKLPIGHERNDLRQLAMGLLWLERKGLQPMIQDRLDAALTTKDFRE